MKKAHCKRDGAIGEQWQRLVEAIEASFEGMFVLDTVFYWQNSVCMCERDLPNPIYYNKWPTPPPIK